VENYQTPNGVIVPDVLQPYLGGMKEFPYVNSEQKVKKDSKEETQG